MAAVKAYIFLENVRNNIACKMVFTLGCLLLMTISYGNCKSVTLSLDQTDALEFESVTFTCSYNGPNNPTSSSWLNYTNGQLRSNIGFNRDTCIAAGFLNDPERFSWSCSGNSSFSLTINRVTRWQQNESWRCTQDYTVSNNVTILVEVPVEAIDLYEEDDNNVTVMENERISFSCNTTYCRPAAKVSWFICPNQCLDHEMEEISVGTNSSSVIDSKGFSSTRSSLELRPDRSKHDWRVFCTASNLESHTISSNKLTLYIIYPPRGPPIIHGVGSIYRVIANRQAKLTCSSSGANPLPDLLWECYNGSSTMTSDDSTVTSSVTWTVTRDQNGTCICRSIHVGGNQSAEIQMDVLYSPTKPNLEIASQKVEHTINKIVNTSLVIYCKSKSKPASTYIWSMLNSSISRGEMLNISHITMSNNGTYTCKAENMMTPSDGETERGISDVSIDVHILFPPNKPELRYDKSDGPVIQTEQLFVVEYDSITLYCLSVGDPEPQYTWNTNTSKQADHIELTNITQDIKVSCTASNIMNDVEGSREGKSEEAVSIAVLYPPRIPVVKYDFNGQGMGKCNPQKGKLSMREYTHISMVCETESNPEASYSWYGPVTSAFKDLEIHNISREKKGTYSCHAFNKMERSFGEIKTGQSHASIRVDVLYPPSVGQLNDTFALEGSTVNIECPVSPGNPAVTNISWTRNTDKPIWTSRYLFLSKLKREDDGIYECLAFNILNPSCENETKGIVRKSFHLNVVYKTMVSNFYVRDKSGLNIVTMNENDPLEIVCETESKPKSNLRIVFGGETLISKPSVNFLTYSKVKASCSDHGIYACYGRNIHNDEEPSEKYLTVHVLCSPRPSPIEASNEYIFTTAGKSVTFRFSALAFPSLDETGYIWLKEQQTSIWTHLKDSKRFKTFVSGLQTSLTISDVTDKDFGRYKLLIENSIGIYDKTFHLLKEAPPAKPSHFKIEEDSLTNTSVTIKWRPFTGYNKAQYFIIQYREEKVQYYSTINVTDNGATVINHTVTDLTSNEWYRVQVSAFNAFGSSDDLALRFQTKSKPSHPKALMVVEESITETAVTLQWTPGYDGGDDQTFALHYKITSKDAREIMSLTIGTSTSNETMTQYLGGLKKGTQYELNLIATNSYGSSDKSEIIKIQTKRFEAIRSEEGESVIIWIWILTGLLVLFAVVVITCVTIVCLRRTQLCRRLLERVQIHGRRTSKHERMTGDLEKITDTTYEGIKSETGIEMADLSQQYESLDNVKKDKTFSVNFALYEDIHIPKESNDSGNKQIPDGYEVPQALSDKKKLMVDQQQNEPS